MLQDEEWPLSKEEPVDDFAKPEEGLQYLQITEASFDDDTDRYFLTMISLTNGATVKQTHFLSKVDPDTNTTVPDPRQRRTIISLKRALYGPDAVGVPNPKNIVTNPPCVVLADVKMVESRTKPGSFFPRIYDYKPVTADIALEFGNPDQFMLPAESGEDTQQEFEE